MKFTNTKKKNNEGLLYKTGVSRPLEDMGSGTTHSTYTESVQNRINEHNTELENIRLRNQRRQRNRQEFQMAIELAKQNTSSNSNVAAGTDRTTQLKNANAQYQAQLAEGKDYLNMNQAQLTGEGIRSLYGSFKNWAAGGEKEISEADSKAHAEETLAPLDAEERKLLQDYVESQDITTSTNLSMGNMYGAPVGIGEFSPIAQSEKRQNAKKAFMEKTGVDEATFEKYIENEAWLTHYNESEARANEIKDTSGAGKAGLTALDVAMANIPSLYAMGGAQKPNDPELGRDYHTPYAALSDVQKQTEEAVNEDIEDIENPIARKAAYFGYNGAVAAGKSAMGLLYGGEIAGALGLEGQAAKNVVNLVTLPTFGVSAYESTYQDAAERGLTTRQATTLAVTAGTAEVVTEVWSLDSLWDLAQNSGSKAAKNAVVNALVQSGIEGSEEVGSDIINDTADVLINGDKSVYYTKVQDYMASGMSEEDAKKQATKDYVDNAINDFVLGAVSGGVSAGAVEGVNAATDTYAGRTIARDNATTSALVLDSESADYISDKREDYNSDEEYNAAQETRQAILDASNQDAMGKRISGKQARAITKGVRDAYANMDARARAVAENLANKQNTSEVSQTQTETIEEATPDEYKMPEKTQSQIVEDIEYASTPYQLSKAIESVTEETPEIQELIDYKKQELQMYGFKADEVDNAITPKKAFEMGQRGEQVSEEQLNTIPEADRKEVLENNNWQYNKSIVRDNPTAIIDQKSGKAFVPSEVKTNGSEVVVVDTDGNEHTDFSNPRISRVESVFSQVSTDYNTGKYTDQNKYNVTVQQAAYAVEMAINSTEATPQLLATAAQSIFDSASVGSKSWSEYVQGTHGLFTTIDQQAAEKLYNSIRESARKSDSAKQRNTEGKRTHSETVSKTLKENLSEESVALYEALGNKIGYDFVASTNKNARGDINPTTRTISIGSNNIDEMWAIANHEAIAEYLQAHGNEQDLLAVQDDMLNYLEEKLGSLEYNNLIDAYQSAYRTGAKDNSVDAGKSRRAAANEMFNDTVFALMSSEEGTKDFINWVSENNTATEQVSILQRVKNFFSKIFDYIQNYIKSGSFNSAERAALEMDAKQAKEFRDRIFKLMDEAIVNAKLNAAVENKNSITPENLERSSKYVNTDKLEDILIDHNYIVAVDDELLGFANDIESGINTKKEVVVNKKVSEKLANDIENIVGFDVSDFDEVVGKNAITHIFKKHGKHGKSDQSMSDNNDIARIGYILKNYDEIGEGKGTRKFHNADGSNAKTVVIMKKIGDKYHYVVEAVPDNKSHRLQIISAYINEKDTLPRVANPNGFAATSETDTSDSASLSTLSITSEPENATATSSRNSISVDTNGRSLSEGQQEYFADSKIRDEQGRLMVVYHGTPYGGFTVFKNELNYYTTNKEYAERYQDPSASSNPRRKDAATQATTYEGYLNITKPFDIEDPETREIFINEYVKGGYALGINPYISDAEIEKQIENGIDWNEAENLLEFIQDNDYDYDGLILDEGGNFDDNGDVNYRGKSYVTFNSNQFKNVDNLNPTDNEDIRFSLKVPVEETKNLIAVHNLHVDDMMRTLELGGFPMPSIAITKPEMGHDMYGNVSVVFYKDTIDPKFIRSNKVYSGDAYTPTFPTIGYKVDSDKINDIRKRIEKLLGDNYNSFGYLGLDTDNVTDYLERNKGDVVDAFSNKDGYKAAYVNDKGINIDIPMKESKLSPHYDNEVVKYIALMFTPEQALESFQNSKETYEMFKKDGRMQKVIDKINAVEKKTFGKLYEKYHTTELEYGEFDQLLSAVNKYYRDGIKQEVDKLAFNEKINEVINNNRADYENWLRKLFDGVIVKTGIRNQKDMFTPSGNRRNWESLYDEYNLMNLVKAMKAEPDVGQGFGGFSIFGSVNREFESIDDIHSEENRLQQADQEKYDKIKDEISNDLYDIARHIKPSASYDAYSIVSDIAEAVAKRKTRNGIKNFLSEWYDVSDSDMDDIMDIINRARELPTGYFEAKPQRAVGFDEIANVIVPDLETELMSKLDEKGIPYTAYKAGDKEARKKALNSVPNVRFSKKIDWNTHNSYKVPARTYDDLVGFNGTDEEIEAAEQQDLAVKSYYANIIHSKKFAGLMFEYKDGNRTKQNFLTKSTREGYDWQYSYGYDNVPHGHNSYRDVNDIVEVYGNIWGDDMTALYQELLDATPKEGVKVHVVREGIAENSRNSFKVYGEASPYADSINETRVVAAMIGSMNNALSKTDVFAMPNDELLRIERYITNKYKVNMDSIEEGDIAANISYAFAYMQQNKLDVDYENMMNFLLNIGDEVIKNSNMKDPETEAIYNETRATLSKYKFKLSDAERAEISNAFGGSWKAAFGAINKAGIKLDNKNGQSVDALFSQIKQEILNTAGIDITEEDKPSQQILALIDTMTALEPTAYLWEGANDMDKSLTVVTDIVEQYYSAATEQLEKNVIKGTEKGKAKIKASVDKEKARLRGEWAKYKENKQKEFNDIVAEKNRIIQEQQNQLRQQNAQMKTWNAKLSEAEKKLQQGKLLSEKQMKQTARLQAQEAVQSYKDRQERAKQIDNIRKTGIRLIKWLTNPSDTQHVPNFLQGPLGEFLSAIDFLPKNPKANAKSTLTWQQRMNSLREALVKIKDAEVEGEDSAEAYFAQNMVAKDLINMMDDFLGKETWDEFTQSYIVTKRSAAKVSQLDAKELQTLNKIMSALSASINNMNKTYANNQFKEISKLAKDSVAEIDKLPSRKDMSKIMGKAFDLLNFDELEPITFFEGLGKGAKSVFDELRQGFNIKTRHVHETDDYIANVKKELGLTDAETSKWKYELHEFDLVEGKLLINTNQIMSLYETLKRKQGKPHVAIGGIKVSDFEYGDSPKKKGHHQPKAIHIMSSEAEAIINTLTDQQKALADAMQQYMAKECSEWGNRVTEKMYGYKKFEEEDYFPLKTDSHTRATTASSDNNVSYYTIKNSSFTKPLTPMANNAVVIDDIFNVFTDHVAKMADYDAYVLPIADAMRWFNYSEKTVNAIAPDELNEAGQRVDYIGNMQESIDRVMGEAGLKYFRQFIKDINGDYAGRGGMPDALNTLMGMYKAQAVGANVRVVIQQPTAVVRAADVIESKYLLQAMTTTHNAMKYAKKAQANSEIAYWKAQGYYETYLGQSLKEIMTGDKTLKDKVTDLGGKLAGWADDLSWGIMYHAAELKVQKTMPQLKIDSAEYTREVVKLFEDIIDHTQVVDTIFHKSQYMRNQGLGYKMTSAFMAEPTKTYNMLYRAFRDARLSGDKAYKLKRLSKVAKIFVFEQMLNAIITAAWDSLRDDEKENYLAGFKDAFLENAFDNLWPLNLIPIAKDIVSFFNGYDATSYVYDGLESLVQTITADKKYITNWRTGEKQSKTTYGITYQNAKAFSQLTGVPVANVMRDATAIYNAVNGLWGGDDLYKDVSTKTKVENAEQKKIFSEAYEKNDLTSAKTAMQDIYNRQIEAGKDESGAWKAVRTTLKEEYLSQIAEHPEDVVYINNRFDKLLENTKVADGKGGYRKPSDKEISNWIEKWNNGSE